MLPLTPSRTRPSGPSGRRARPWHRLPTLPLSVDALMVLLCTWFALGPNRSFVQAALKGRDAAEGL